MSQFQPNFITTVINRYGLELDGHQVDTIIVTWLQKYDSDWIIKAIIESLYRGRYKIVSVENILKDWQRLGKPRYNFTPEYEREILQNLPVINDPPATSLLPILPAPVDRPDPPLPVTQIAVLSSKHLNPEESAPFQHRNHSRPTASTNNANCTVPASAVQNLENSHPTANLLADHDSSFASRPPSLQMIRERGDANENHQSNLKPHRCVPQPAKFQLFNTLKAIVDPNNQQGVEVRNSACLPLSAENINFPRIAKFKLHLEHASEQHQL